MKQDSKSGQLNLQMVKTTKKGIYFAILTAVISGVSIFVNKFAVIAINEPLVFTAVKNTGVAFILLTLLLSSGKLKKIKKLNKKQLTKLFLIGVVGGSIPFYLFFTGLSMIPAINGAVIHKTLVLWVSVLAYVFLKEKLSGIGWLTIITLFAANTVVGGFNGFQLSRGELYVLLATVMWAIENVIAKKVLKKVDSDIVVEARMGIGAIVLLALSVILKPQSLLIITSLTFDNLLWLLATMGLLTTYVITWYRALKYAPAILVSIILVGSTLVTNILSAIFVTHTLNIQMLIQFIVITIAFIVFYKVGFKSNTNKRIAVA